MNLKVIFNNVPMLTRSEVDIGYYVPQDREVKKSIPRPQAEGYFLTSRSEEHNIQYPPHFVSALTLFTL